MNQILARAAVHSNGYGKSPMVAFMQHCKRGFGIVIFKCLDPRVGETLIS